MGGVEINYNELNKLKWTEENQKLGKGPSKNYVTPRGGEGVNDFVTCRYVYLRGREISIL